MENSTTQRQVITCEECGAENTVPVQTSLGYSPGNDKIITCIECNDEFVWNAGEQQYYFDRGLNMPMRCQECRAKRNQRVEQLKTNGLTADASRE